MNSWKLKLLRAKIVSHILKMDEKVRLYYQVCGDIPLWDFCLHAWYGARENNVAAIKFEFPDEIPHSPYHIVVGSTEAARRWLTKNGYQCPPSIDCKIRHYPYNRIYPTCEKFLTSAVNYPVFIKPADVIKLFTGTVVRSKEEAALILNGLQCAIETKPLMNYTSEWRVYIHKGKLLKVCHYLGDPGLMPNMDIVNETLFVLKKYKHPVFTYNSFTIDVGYDQNENSWFVIELNDGWSIGNYGLDSDKYYHFLKDRWFQLTGLLPYKMH